MLQQRKIARWLRELKHEPPKDSAEKPYVIQHVFKVTPPMEWVDHVAYRHGKLIKDRVHGMPNRMRVQSRSMEKARLEGRSWWPEGSKPRYTYGKRVHRTSFVLVSASDLKTFMNASSARMEKLMRERGDKEGERLFRRRDHFEVETYIFPCDKWGKWKDGSLEGSQRGTLDHRVPLQDAGYTVIGMPYNLVLYGESV